MKKFMTGAMTALLMASTAAPALAQQGGYPDGDPRNSGGRARAGAWINRNPDYRAPQAQPAPEVQQAPQVERGPSDGGGDRNRGDGHRGGGEHRRGDDDGRRDRGDRHWDRGDQNRGDRNWDRGDHRDRNWDRGDHRDRNWDRDRHWDRDRNWHRDRNWSDRDWRERNRDRPRYDRRHYPPIYRAPHRFRGPIYRPPSGFYYRSWVFGDVLPRGWYGPEYRVLDWWTYGLPIPPAGYEWVRIGDDAVLVDMFNGRIVQVVHDLFW